MTNVPHGGLAITCIFHLGSVITDTQIERERDRERELAVWPLERTFRRRKTDWLFMPIF